MPTEVDFNNAIKNWINYKDPKRAVPLVWFGPFRQIFLGFVRKGNQTAAEGVLHALQCCTDTEEIWRLVNHSAEFCSMEVPVYKNNGKGYKQLALSFFDIAGLFTRMEALNRVMLDLADIADLTPLNGALGKCLSSAIMNVSHNLLLDDVIRSDINRAWLVATRLHHLTVYLQQTVQDFPQLAQEYTWEPTGSDPHQGGRQVLLLKKGGSIRRVFKPRSMVADQSLLTANIGQTSHGILPTCSSLMGSYIGFHGCLPSLLVECLEMQQCGLEDYATKKNILTKDEALVYYTKLGTLLFFAKLFGCTDLHQDNVLVTADGPVIIDAECILTPGVIAAQNFDSTLISGTLCGDRNIFQEPASSSFLLNGSASSDEINTAFRSGFHLAQNLVSTPGVLETLRNLFHEALQRSPLIRYVPIPTTDMAVAIEAFAAGIQEVPADLLGQLQDIALKSMGLQLDIPITLKALKKALSQGDIPCMQIEVRLGKLSPFRINGEVVGECNTFEKANELLNLFDENLNRLRLLPLDKLPKVFLPS